MSFYPAKGDWPTVAKALNAHTIAELKLLAEAAGIRPEGRKAERIEHLCHSLEGQRLRFLWGRLSPSQRAAVAMAAYSRSGRLSREGYRVLHNQDPDFGERSRFGPDIARPSLLCLFIHGDRIPGDLRRRLQEIVPAPDVSPVRTFKAPPDRIAVSVPDGRRENLPLLYEVHVAKRSAAALLELQDMTHLLEARSLSVTPRTQVPSSSSERAVAAILAGGRDFLDEGPIRAYAWPRLLLSGGLARAQGGALVLTPAGGRALQDPRAETQRDLWRNWLTHGEPDELHRISGLRGSTSKDADLTPPSSRRDAIADAMRDCPIGEWVPIDAFFQHLQISGRDFEVSASPEALRVECSEGSGGLRGYGSQERWLILQGRYVLCFLFEYAATLGVVDVAYTPPAYARPDIRDVTWGNMLSNYDGLLAFRLTELGAFCLGLTAGFPDDGAEFKPFLQVNDTLEIRSDTAVSAADQLVLSYWAEPLSERAWTLSRTRTLESLAKGRSSTVFGEFLGRRLTGSLPSTLRSFLKDCEHRARSLRPAGRADLFECRDAELAALIARDSCTGRYCHRAGDTLVAVPVEHEGSFRRALRRAGFDVDVKGRRAHRMARDDQRQGKP